MLRRIGRWLRRHDDEMAEEIEQHRALAQVDLERRGLAPDEAAAASRRVMGNMRVAREQARDVWVVAGLDRLRRDARCAVRSLAHDRTFTATATLTLGLGVATATTVFSVVDAQLWKPLPYPHPDRLVSVYSSEHGKQSVDAISGADLLEWRAGAPAFSDLASEGATRRRILRRDTAESVVVTEVTPNFPALLGRPAALGRAFAPGDVAGGHAAMLTDAAWRRIFAADPGVIGRSIAVDDDTFVVTGVLAADDPLWIRSDLLVALDERDPSFLDRAHTQFPGGIGRLARGVTIEVARAQLQAVVGRRGIGTGHAAAIVFLQDLGDAFTYNARPLLFFLGASLIVLLLSTVNVATLLLARAFGRTREFALRGALGGGRAALAGQLLVEGAVLAVPGAAIAVLVSHGAVGVFTTQLPGDFFPRGAVIPIDLRVCVFALATTGLTTVVFALAPLMIARRLNLSAALAPGRRAGRTAAEGRVRTALLVAQIAVTVVLLSGAGIFLESFVGLTRVPLGFDPANLLSVRTALSGPRYVQDDAVRAYAGRLVETARALPGVAGAAIGTSSPLGSGPLVNYAVPGNPPPADGRAPRAILRAVGPDYFRTIGIRLVRGREVASGDVTGAPRVAVINETLARQAFGDDDPIGRTLDLLPARAPWTNHPGTLVVVGVAPNAKEVGINEVAFADLYVPFAQMPSAQIELVVRAGVAAGGLISPLRQAAAHVDPGVPVTNVSTFEQRVASALQTDRFNLLLISGFAAVSLVLAAVGVYGAVGYHVQARTRELGVRLALGAHPLRLVGRVAWGAGRIGLAGGAIGLLATLATARMIGRALYLVPGDHAGLLYGVTTTEPTALAAACAGVVVIALVAGFVPARRVAHVDPTMALRSE